MHDACKKCLLQVISYVWTKSIDDVAEMAVTATCDVWHLHMWSNHREYMYKGGVENLPTKLAKVGFISILLGC